MMLVAEEGIVIDYHPLALMKGEHLTPEYKAINPNGWVPTLDDDGFRLAQSGAIVRYLADKAGSDAYPRDLRERAKVDEAIEWFYISFYKDFGCGLVYPQLFAHHKRPEEGLQAGTIASGRDLARHWLNILDTDMIGPKKKFICGSKVTIAEYVGAELVSLGELVHRELQDYPNVCRWIGNMKALDSWPEVHQVFDGFVASSRDKQFDSI